MVKEKKKTKKPNKWKTATMVLIFMIVWLLIWMALFQPNMKEKEEAERLCQSIQYTPAWVDSYGEIINYGVILKPENTTSDIIKEFLIPERIKFVYNSDCYACQNQIRDFGNSWIEYENSGLTVNCNEVN